MIDLVLTDTHCHLDFKAYRADLDRVIERAVNAGIARILTMGIDVQSSESALRLAEKYPEVFAAVGVHPNTELDWSDRVTSDLERLLVHEKVVAVGEIGLDYYRDHTNHEMQRARFKEQLHIAANFNLPVIIHSRNASPNDHSCMEDVLHTLGTWRTDTLNQKDDGLPLGVLHSYFGSEEEAKRAYSLGFYTGITGPVTFKNAEDQQELVKKLPLDKLLIETDGPFLTPHPHRGRRNEPSYVKFIAEKIADLKDLPLEKVAKITSENAQRLFNWS